MKNIKQNEKINPAVEAGIASPFDPSGLNSPKKNEKVEEESNVNWDNMDYEQYKLGVERKLLNNESDIEREINHTESRNLLLDISYAATGTVLDAGVQVFEALTDLGILTGDYAVEIGVKELSNLVFDENERKNLGLNDDLRGQENKAIVYRDKVTNYISDLIPEPDREGANLAKDIATSLIVFSVGFGKFKALGLGRTASAGGAGAVEGFLRDDEDMFLMGTVWEKMATGLGEDVYKTGMDLLNPENQENEAVLARRFANAVEMSLLSVVGERVTMRAEKYVQPQVKKLKEAIVSQGVFLRKAQKEIGKKLGIKPKPQKLKVDVSTLGDDAVEAGIASKFNPHALKVNLQNLDVDKPLSEQTGVFASEFSFDQRFNPSEALKAYYDSVESNIGKIADEVVSMSKSRNMAEEELASKLLNVTPEEIAKDSWKQGLRDVLNAQAHNVLMEQQAMKMQGTLRIVRELGDDVPEEAITRAINAVEDFGRASEMWQKQATSAGRALRAQGELDKGARKLLEEIQDTGEVAGKIAQKDAVEAVGENIIQKNRNALIEKMKQNPEYAKEFVDDLSDLSDRMALVGDGADSLAKGMNKALSNKDGVTFRKVVRSMENTFVAGLLTGVPTLVQNQFSSYLHMTAKAGESVIEASFPSIPGVSRVAGTPSLPSALKRFGNIQRDHINVLALSMKAVANMARKKDAKAFQSTFVDSKFFDIDGIPDNKRRAMLRLEKEDVARVEGQVTGKDFTENADTQALLDGVLYWGTGQPIYKIIQAQDMVTKTIGARNFMQQAVETAITDSDALKLGNKKWIGKGKEGDKKREQIKKAFVRLINNPEQPDSKALARELGITEKRADMLIARFERAKLDASDSAIESAIDDAFQTRIKELEKVREVLQDSAGARFLVPFFMTPVNIVNETLKRYPAISLGEAGIGLPMHPSFYRDVMSGGKASRQAMSRLIMGNALFQTGMNLYEQGSIIPQTDDWDKKKFVRDMFGIQTGSIIINGISFNAQPFGPAGMLMIAGARFQEMMKENQGMENLSAEQENTTTDFLLSGVTGIMEQFRDLPMMTWADQTASFLSSTEKGISKKVIEGLVNKASLIIPYSSARRQAMGNIDPYERSLEFISDKFFNNVWSQKATYRYNAFGERVKDDGNIFLRGVEMYDDSLASEIMKVDYYPPALKAEISVDGNTIPLNRDEFERYVDIYLSLNPRKALQKVIDAPQYKENMESLAGINQNKKIISSTFSALKRQAGQELYGENNSIRDRIESENKEEGVGAVAPAISDMNNVTTPTFRGR